MISILATIEHYNHIMQFNLDEELNRRGFWNMFPIPFDTPSAVNEYVKSYVMDNDIENVIVDVDIYENKLQLIELLRKLKILSGFDLYVVAIEYSRKDALLKHILDLGIDTNSVITGSIHSVCRLLATNIFKDQKKVSQELLDQYNTKPYQLVTKDDSDAVEAVLQETAEIKAKPVVEQQKQISDPRIEYPDNAIQDMLERMNRQVQEIFSTDTVIKKDITSINNEINKRRLPVTPPVTVLGNISTPNPEPPFVDPNSVTKNNQSNKLLEKVKIESAIEAQISENNNQQSKPIHSFYTNKKHATTIGVIGAGRRVGTTTQALQIVQYLKNCGFHTAIVEMNNTGHLSSHLNLMSDELQQQSIFDNNHFMINNIDIYRLARSVVEAKSLYEYVVCDYGDGSSIDITSFLERDVKIVVGCLKPYEIKLLHPFFKVDGVDFNYIYSFVDKALWDDIRMEMGEAAGRTHFAGYAPDFFRYAGDDHIYGQILPEIRVFKQQQIIENESKTNRLLSLVRQIRGSKGETVGYTKKREHTPSL